MEQRAWTEGLQTARAWYRPPTPDRLAAALAATPANNSGINPAEQL